MVLCLWRSFSLCMQHMHVSCLREDVLSASIHEKTDISPVSCEIEVSVWETPASSTHSVIVGLMLPLRRRWGWANFKPILDKYFVFSGKILTRPVNSHHITWFKALQRPLASEISFTATAVSGAIKYHDLRWTLERFDYEQFRPEPQPTVPEILPTRGEDVTPA